MQILSSQRFFLPFTMLISLPEKSTNLFPDFRNNGSIFYPDLRTLVGATGQLGEHFSLSYVRISIRLTRFARTFLLVKFLLALSERKQCRIQNVIFLGSAPLPGFRIHSCRTDPIDYWIFLNPDIASRIRLYGLFWIILDPVIFSRPYPAAVLRIRYHLFVSGFDWIRSFFPIRIWLQCCGSGISFS